MAKISEVVSALSVKVNVGDYQSVDFFTSMKTMTSDDAEPFAAAHLNGLCNAAMLSNLRAHFKARGKKLSDAEICKRYGLVIPKSPNPEFG